MGIEPTTYALPRRCSTGELLGLAGQKPTKVNYGVPTPWQGSLSGVALLAKKPKAVNCPIVRLASGLWGDDTEP